MPYAAIAIGLLVLAGIVFGAWRLWTGVPEADRRRATWPVVGFALAVIVGLTAAMYAQAYYRVPALVLVGLIALWIAVLTLAVMTVRVIGRTGRTFLLLATVFVAAAAATLLAGMFSPLGMPTGLIETRAAQIAEANGFVALLPEGERMVSDYMPVDAIDETDVVLTVEYEDFMLHERKAATPMDEDDLRALLSSGSRPVGWAEVPRDAEIEVLDVNGRPALGATFLWTPAEGEFKGLPGDSRVSVLVLEVDGVDVRMESVGHQVYTGANEQYEYRPALALEELAAIAGRLAPVE